MIKTVTRKNKMYLFIEFSVFNGERIQIEKKQVKLHPNCKHNKNGARNYLNH